VPAYVHPQSVRWHCGSHVVAGLRPIRRVTCRSPYGALGAGDFGHLVQVTSETDMYPNNRIHPSWLNNPTTGRP